MAGDPEGAEPHIRLRGVGCAFPVAGGAPVVALRDLDLEVARGETLVLIGASGSGKTTALRLVNRLLEPSRGRVEVGGRDVREQDPIRLRRGIGYVIQSGGLFPHLTVAENVCLLCRLEGWDAPRAAARAAELLARVRLDPDALRRALPGELSGGERQRVGLARALALDPEIVLMDEPFGALDPITRAELREELLALEGLLGKTLLIVTHDLDEAFLLGDRVALMERGAIAQVGDLEAFRERPASRYVEQFLERHLRA